MADYNINNAYLVSGNITTGTAGAAIANAGVPVYKDYQDKSELKAADNTLTAGAARVAGISLDAYSADDTVRYALKGARVFFAFSAGSFSKGDIVVLSAGGLLMPSSDLQSTDFVTIIGIAEDNNVVELLLHFTGITRV